jgi:hypothetical protein
MRDRNSAKQAKLALCRTSFLDLGVGSFLGVPKKARRLADLHSSPPWTVFLLVPPLSSLSHSYFYFPSISNIFHSFR